MPKYFFHLRRDGILEFDPDGVECLGIAAARDEATRTAREMISHEALSGSPQGAFVFEITDETGRIVARVAFSHTIGFEELTCLRD